MHWWHDVAPELEEKLRPSLSPLDRVGFGIFRGGSLMQEASHSRRLNVEWHKGGWRRATVGRLLVLLKVSRRISTFLPAEVRISLVILSASNTVNGWAGLILTSAGVQHVPLPDVTFANLNHLVEPIKLPLLQEVETVLYPSPIQHVWRTLFGRSPYLRSLGGPTYGKASIRHNWTTWWLLPIYYGSLWSISLFASWFIWFDMTQLRHRKLTSYTEVWHTITR